MKSSLPLCYGMKCVTLKFIVCSLSLPPLLIIFGIRASKEVFEVILVHNDLHPNPVRLASLREEEDSPGEHKPR